MNIKLLILLIIVLGTIAPAMAQKKLKPIAGDCDSAIKIILNKKGFYGPTVPPNGFGKKNEIKAKQGDKYFFEQEHNSAWYCFNTTTNGKLGIIITPTNEKDDYDFILFKYTDSSFCADVIKKKITPVRTNISRTGKGGTSTTGLSDKGENEFFSSGIGKPFSKSIEVKKGEKYYLVLDNVYPNGEGHTIEIGFQKEIQISGTVLNEENKPIKADVVLEDTKGNEIAKTISDPITGNYFIKENIFTNANYSIIYLEDSSFVGVKELKSLELDKNNYQLKDIKTILPKLKKGEKYRMNDINFYGDSPTPLPSAYPSIKALYKLMKKNPNMIISIEGHVNNPNGTDNNECDQLSQNRATTICNYLLDRKISKDRMSTIGYGSKFMLFPNPKNESEQIQNRRVEIKVISY